MIKPPPEHVSAVMDKFRRDMGRPAINRAADHAVPLGEIEGVVPPPDGIEVERLAIHLAAALGHAWASVSTEGKRQFRVMANAAIDHLSPQGAAA